MEYFLKNKYYLLRLIDMLKAINKPISKSRYCNFKCCFLSQGLRFWQILKFVFWPTQTNYKVVRIQILSIAGVTSAAYYCFYYIRLCCQSKCWKRMLKSMPFAHIHSSFWIVCTYMSGKIVFEEKYEGPARTHLSSSTCRRYGNLKLDINSPASCHGVDSGPLSSMTAWCWWGRW